MALRKESSKTFEVVGTAHAPGNTRLVDALVFVVLGALALAGLVPLGYRLASGLGVTNLGSVVPWGVWVSFYIFFIGLSAGSFLLSTLIFVFGNKKLEPVGRLAVIQAFFCLLTGLIFVWIDLGQWQRFWEVMVYPQWHSVLAWEIWFYNAYIVLLLAEMWFLLRCDLSRWAIEAEGVARAFYRTLSLGHRCASDTGRHVCAPRTANWLMVLGMIGIPIALGVHGGTGAIFAVAKARAGWNSPIFPLVFIVSALASGGALLLSLRAFVVRGDGNLDLLRSLARITGAILIFDLLLLGLEFLVALYSAVPDHQQVYDLMATGPYWEVFWIQELLVGALVPLLLIFVRTDHAGALRLGLAGLLIVIGIFGVRLNIVIPALAVTELPGFAHAFDSTRLSDVYHPNWVEWLSGMGIVAFMALVGYAAIRLLPMHEDQPYGRPGR